MFQKSFRRKGRKDFRREELRTIIQAMDLRFFLEFQGT
jgi:hypothetical protein